MLSSELEVCLNEAFQSAREARHEFMTVEHLLLAIVATPKVEEILRGCGADSTRLGKELDEFIEETTPRLKPDDEREVQPTLGFQRVLQRAVFHVQSSGTQGSVGCQRAGGDFQREAFPRGLPARAAGRVEARRGQFHLPRPVQAGRGGRAAG